MNFQIRQSVLVLMLKFQCASSSWIQSLAFACRAAAIVLATITTAAGQTFEEFGGEAETDQANVLVPPVDFDFGHALAQIRDPAIETVDE